MILPLQILLVLETAVERQEHFKTSLLRERKQLSILLAGKPLFGHGTAIVSGQQIPEFSGDALIK